VPIRGKPRSCFYETDVFHEPQTENPDYFFFRENYRQDHIQTSVRVVLKLIKDEFDQLGDASKIFLCGFNQGCPIVLQAFLQTNVGALGGVWGYGGVMCASVDNWSEINIRLKRNTPIKLYHGSDDFTVP
jgi:predicted esterase